MEIKDMNLEQIEERLTAIQSEMTAEGADLDALTSEVDELEARKAEIEAQIEKRAALEERVKAHGVVVKDFKQEERKEMTNAEVRNSDAYVLAYANYIKTEKDAECRALLTENVSGGTLPVPDFLDETIRTAWEEDDILRRINTTTLPGNIRQSFEVSASDAVVHVEGSGAIDPEVLVLGIVEAKPETIKKYVEISDEAIDTTAQATEFLNYIYDELTHKIAEKAVDEFFGLIDDAPAVSSTSAVGIPSISVSAIGLDTMTDALAELKAVARNPVAMMTRRTRAAFIKAAKAAQYGQDPFDGVEVVLTDSLKDFSTAEADDTVVVVGDLGRGARVNFPNGRSIRTKYDDLTKATEDLVRVIGRMPVAMAIVGPGCFVKVKKAAAESEGGEG